MARTLNLAVRTVRQEAFVEAAQRLIQAKGYESMSVQDVLDEVGASRGAFYHYFDSKQALLEAVAERMADAAMTALAPLVDDPDLPTIRKFEGVFAGLQSFKAENKALVLAVFETWTSDDNALLREKLRRISLKRLVPMMAAIIRQGNRERAFHTGSADHAAMVLVRMLLGFGDHATDLLLGRRAGTVAFEDVERAVAANTEAIERILGLTAGSLTLIDGPTLHFWFD